MALTILSATQAHLATTRTGHGYVRWTSTIRSCWETDGLILDLWRKEKVSEPVTHSNTDWQGTELDSNRGYFHRWTLFCAHQCSTLSHKQTVDYFATFILRDTLHTQSLHCGSCLLHRAKLYSPHCGSGLTHKAHPQSPHFGSRVIHRAILHTKSLHYWSSLIQGDKSHCPHYGQSLTERAKLMDTQN